MAYIGQTLENPASGERITFRRTAADTAGALVAIDLELPAARRVPDPLHVHPHQEERFEVIDGTMRFRLGRKRIVAGPGEVVVVPAGVAHDFANPGETAALVRVVRTRVRERGASCVPAAVGPAPRDRSAPLAVAREGLAGVRLASPRRGGRPHAANVSISAT